jgi:putative glycosyltransferase (TIGR04372 family)
MISRIKTNLIKYFFFGNSISNDGYLRLAYLLGRFIVFLPLSIGATLVLGVYSIFRPVKIFMLRCDRSKISFIVEDLEVALRIERHNTKNPGAKPALLFAVLDCDSPNKAFTAMYGRFLPFLDDDRPFFRGIIRYTPPILRIERRYLARRQSENQMIIWSESPPTLAFTNTERQLGAEIEMNLLSHATKPFVCIALPEKSYYETKMDREHPVSESTDLFSSFPDWESYFQCIESLNDAGLDVLRMGQLVDSTISPGISKLIDYASTSRSEFGDVWLLGNCKFVIAGAGTGIYWPASALNKPSLLTDSYGLFNTSYGQWDLKTPQLAWSRSERKLMPFSWMIKQGEGWAHKRSLIEDDIEIVKNTSEEITEVVLEMDQRLNGTWIETEEDIELQNRFKKLRDAVPKWQVQEGVRIGADFLRRYQHLL